MQLAVLQFRDGEQAVDEGKQMLRLVFYDAEIFLLHFRLLLQYAAVQILGSHDDGGERRLHIVNHRIGEVLAQQSHPFLLIDVVDLLDEAQDDYHRGKERGENRELAFVEGSEQGLCPDIRCQVPGRLISHLMNGHLQRVPHPEQLHAEHGYQCRGAECLGSIRLHLSQAFQAVSCSGQRIRLWLMPYRLSGAICRALSIQTGREPDWIRNRAR